MNIEHRTSNIEHRIMYSIYFKKDRASLLRRKSDEGQLRFHHTFRLRRINQHSSFPEDSYDVKLKFLHSTLNRIPLLPDCPIQLSHFRFPTSHFPYRSSSFCPTSAFQLPNSNHPLNLPQLISQPFGGYRDCGFKLLGKYGNLVFLQHPKVRFDGPALFIGYGG